MWDPVLLAKLFVLGVFAAAGCYVHFRGQVRHSFVRQLTDHSTFMAPYNSLVYLFSRVPNKPVLKVEDLPDLSLLRANWEMIRDEADRVSAAGQVRSSQKLDDLAFNSFFRHGWKRFYLKWYDDYLPSACEQCPQTVALLKQVSGLNAAMFARLPPHSELVAHRDPFAGSLRYHLGLRTPNSPDCRIDIDGTPYHWRDGEDILFDETYIHRARNDTDQPRVILFCDVERPLRTAFARAINRFTIDFLMPLTASKNTEQERIGLINHLFGWVYRIRQAGKWLRNKNETTYYAIKYSALAGLLFLLLR